MFRVIQLLLHWLDGILHLSVINGATRKRCCRVQFRVLGMKYGAQYAAGFLELAFHNQRSGFRIADALLVRSEFRRFAKMLIRPIEVLTVERLFALPSFVISFWRSRPARSRARKRTCSQHYVNPTSHCSSTLPRQGISRRT
ncbi:MAG: hypothetical protein D6691_05680 [Candidatus Hydrogenedentota bacterium]|nr:MAG: hypothetical protein D6691_05680 [Candidatus Hydrogenedentota bacterium]